MLDIKKSVLPIFTLIIGFAGVFSLDLVSAFKAFAQSPPTVSSLQSLLTLQSDIPIQSANVSAAVMDREPQNDLPRITAGSWRTRPWTLSVSKRFPRKSTDPGKIGPMRRG
jgi:hypothetical protein